MSVTEALAVFRRLGFEIQGFSPARIKEIRNKLLLKHHPDLNPASDQEIVRMINTAYSVLRARAETLQENPNSVCTGESHEIGTHYLFWIYSDHGELKMLKRPFYSAENAIAHINGWDFNWLARECQLILVGAEGCHECYLVWDRGTWVHPPRRMNCEMDVHKPPTNLVHDILWSSSRAQH